MLMDRRNCMIAKRIGFGGMQKQCIERKKNYKVKVEIDMNHGK